MPIDFISFAYAAAVAAGGIAGYAKAGSIPSLGAGLVFGSILGYGAFQTSQNPNNYYLLLGTSTVLGGLMGMRYYNSGKFMPAGLVTILSKFLELSPEETSEEASPSAPWKPSYCPVDNGGKLTSETRSRKL